MTSFIIPLAEATALDAERIGPKAANLAALARAGLPTPGGFCLSANAYDAQIAALGLKSLIRRFAAAESIEQRRLSIEIRLALYERPIAPAILAPLCAAWDVQRKASERASAVRSSALIEDRKGSNFAGQFESFLGIDDEATLITAVRACWAALWTTTARRAIQPPGKCSSARPGDWAPRSRKARSFPTESCSRARVLFAKSRPAVSTTARAAGMAARRSRCQANSSARHVSTRRRRSRSAA